MQRDVELADGDLGALDVLDAGREAAGEGHAAGRDAEQDETVAALVALEDLVTDAPQRPGDVALAHDVSRVGRGARAGGGLAQVRAGHSRWTSFPASQDGG